MNAFKSCALAHGLLADMTGDGLSTVLSAWSDGALELRGQATHLGYVYDGSTAISCASGSFTLSPGMYFSIPGDGLIHGAGKGVVVSRLDYRGFFQIGGPIEDIGRLKYIDGCTDSLLIPPVVMGDACFNLLHFPPGIRQTPHTHPSLRVGMVVRGGGECVTPTETIPLIPGQVFVISALGVHSFNTDESPMTIVAYHPDSDFGPTDEDHPMINRTIVNGQSARLLDTIRTK